MLLNEASLKFFELFLSETRDGIGCEVAIIVGAIVVVVVVGFATRVPIGTDWLSGSRR